MKGREEENHSQVVTQGFPFGSQTCDPGVGVLTGTSFWETGFPNPLLLWHYPHFHPDKLFLNLFLAPSVSLPVSSILARVSGWRGSLDGASPLYLSRGHGGGLTFCSSAQSWVGHGWAEESILKNDRNSEPFIKLQGKDCLGWGNMLALELLASEGQSSQRPTCSHVFL